MSTTGGPGVYRSVADAVRSVEAALKATAQRALDGVADEAVGAPEVIFGDAVEAIGTANSSPDLIGVEVSGTQADAGTVGASRREKHVVKLDVTIICIRATDDPAETVSRAWELLGLIDIRIRSTEPDLTDPSTPSEHPSLWCRLTSTDSASADAKTAGGYGGRVTGIKATFEAAVIVQI